VSRWLTWLKRAMTSRDVGVVYDLRLPDLHRRTVKGKEACFPACATRPPAHEDSKMNRLTLLGLAIIGLVCFAAWPDKAAAQTCQTYYDQASSAVSQTPPDLPALQQLRDQVNNSSVCADVEKTCFAYFVANAHAARASAIEEAHGPLDEGASVAQAGFNIAQTWRSSWTLAHFSERRKDYDRASLLYQGAISQLADTQARIEAHERQNESFTCPGEKENLPTPAAADELTRLAIQMSALSQSFVRLPAARCGGDFGGVFIGKLGCNEINRFTIPIEFQYDSTLFTKKGTDAAKFLAEFIITSAKQRNRVVLTGHSDQKGSERYNCDLTKRRLDAVVKFLRRNGVGAEVQVDTVPQGLGEPFPIVEGSELSADEIDRINRRVELRDDADKIVRKCGL
jgi:outer membrane protein OmpA-like peptidoglycan-associated protein